VRWRFIINITGILILFLGLTMILPLLCGLYYKDQSVISLAKSIAITVIAGFLFYLLSRAQKNRIHQPA